MKNNIKEVGLYGWIFALFIGSGPIYWMPWIPVALLEIIKLSLYLVLIVWPLFCKIEASRFHFPGGIKVFSLMVAFFALAIPSMFIGEFESTLYKIQNTVQIFMLVYACGYLGRLEILSQVTRLSVKIFAFFCLLSLTLILLVPNYVSPLNDALLISQTGFGGSRTGWSPAIALYLPWLYAGFFASGIWVFLIALSMVANQILVVGRTGMVSALIAFLVYRASRKNVVSILVTLSIIGIIYVFSINNLEILRLSSDGTGGRQALDELSTGRTEIYFKSIYIIADNFITGLGIGEIKYEGVTYAIHNIILKSAAESGALHALTIVGIFFIALKRGWRGVVQKDSFVIAAFLTVLTGIVSSLFEPVGMFGTFYNAGFWWLCFSICVERKRPSVKII